MTGAGRSAVAGIVLWPIGRLNSIVRPSLVPGLSVGRGPRRGGGDAPASARWGTVGDTHEDATRLMGSALPRQFYIGQDARLERDA